MPEPRYELTSHALTVIAERQINTAWIERVLENPDRTEPGKADPSLTHALGRIPEHGDRVLRVVYNARVDPPRIVTAYFDRGQKGKP